MFETDCWEVRVLAAALIGGSQPAYERLREGLISQYSYDVFRDLQSRAFEVALYGHEVSRPPCTCILGQPFHHPHCPEYQR